MVGESPTAPPLGVILTAGKGTRLQPLTPRLSKAAIPLLNRPLIAYAFDAVAALGIEEVAVVVGPDDRVTPRRAHEHARGPLSIHVQERPNGPGDAVASVGDLLAGRHVVVFVVDAVFTGLDARPLDAFVASGAGASLVLKPVHDPRNFGVAVVEDGHIVDLEEKPAEPRSNMAVVGIWMLAPDLVERVRMHPFINARGESDLTATVAQALREGTEVLAWPHDGEWLDAGTLPSLLRAQGRLLRDLAPTPVIARESDLSGPVAAGSGCVVTMSKLTGPVLLGCDARLDACDVADSVIGDGAVLQGVRLRRSMVLGGAQMQGGDYEDVVVTAAGEVVGPGAL